MVRNTPKGPTFSIPSTRRIVINLNGTENFYRCLKMESLKMYIEYRLQGENKLLAMTKVLQMRDADMFNSKNLPRGSYLLTSLLMNMSSGCSRSTWRWWSCAW